MNDFSIYPPTYWDQLELFCLKCMLFACFFNLTNRILLIFILSLKVACLRNRQESWSMYSKNFERCILWNSKIHPLVWKWSQSKNPRRKTYFFSKSRWFRSRNILTRWTIRHFVSKHKIIINWKLERSWIRIRGRQFF